jgi:hypothetical protein
MSALVEGLGSKRTIRRVVHHRGLCVATPEQFWASEQSIKWLISVLSGVIWECLGDEVALLARWDNGK